MPKKKKSIAVPKPESPRSFSAQEVAAGQVLAHASGRYALRRVLNACEPNQDGSFTFARDAEAAKFLSNTVIRRNRAKKVGPWFVVRVQCQPEVVRFTCRTFEEAVATATPFENIFPVSIIAC